MHVNVHACMRAQDVDCKKIAALVSRGHAQSYRADVEHYAKYVMNYAGGIDGALLHELDRFCKSPARVRPVQSDVYSMVSAISLAQAPLYVVALVKATLSCHDKLCGPQGKAKVFLPSDIATTRG